MAVLLLGFLMGVAPIWSLRRFPSGHWVYPLVGKTAVGRAGAGLQWCFKICSGTEVCRPASWGMDGWDFLKVPELAGLFQGWSWLQGHFKIHTPSKFCRPPFRVMVRCDFWVLWQMMLVSRPRSSGAVAESIMGQGCFQVCSWEHHQWIYHLSMTCLLKISFLGLGFC